MKLKRFNSMNEEITPADKDFVAAQEDAKAAQEEDKFWSDSKAYNDTLDKYLTQHDNPQIRQKAKELAKEYDYETYDVHALMYNLLVEVNDHKLAKEFVELVKKSQS